MQVLHTSNNRPPARPARPRSHNKSMEPLHGRATEREKTPRYRSGSLCPEASPPPRSIAFDASLIPCRPENQVDFRGSPQGRSSRQPPSSIVTSRVSMRWVSNKRPTKPGPSLIPRRPPSGGWRRPGVSREHSHAEAPLRVHISAGVYGPALKSGTPKHRRT